MRLRIDPSGLVMCLYAEAVDLSLLGDVTVRRASHVEPDDVGRWWADLAPSGGPRLGPFALRSQALAAEEAWLDENLRELSMLPATRGTAGPGGEEAAAC